jgi:broad specificity phosphatase PhoE
MGSDPRNRLPWRVFLPVLLLLLACGCGAGQMETAARAPEATAAQALQPTAIPTIRATAAPVAAAAPTATAPATAAAAPTTPAGPLRGEQLVSALRGGGYVIYFRHAATDQIPDDAVPVVLSDCATQRNLSAAGRAHSQAIGQAMERLGIPIGLVLSSPFCRALDTARLAFGRAAPEPAMENLETVRSEAEREARTQGLRRLLATPPERATNSVLVAHGVNISGAARVTIPEGGAAIFRPDGQGGFALVATVTPREWEELAAALAPSR